MKAPADKIGERLRRYVRGLAKEDELAKFLRIVNAHGEAFVFGGAARDVVFYGSRAVNDLDIFVSGRLEDDALAAAFGGVRKTNFGGYRLAVGNHDVDVWELDKSYAFRFDSASYVSVGNLLKSVCFSTDAIAVSTVSGAVIKTSDFDFSFSNDYVNFVVPPNTLDPLVAARIARISLKLGLDLSPAVASFFVSCYELYGSAVIISAEARWGAKRMLTEIAIEEVRSKILASIDRASGILGVRSQFARPFKSL